MIFLVTKFVICLNTFALPAQEKQKTDLKTLQGTWVMIGLEVDGTTVGENKIANTELQIKGDLYTTIVKGKKHVARIELFPKKKPAAIDMIPQDGPNKDQVLKGIYRIKNGNLQICRGLGMDQQRPAAFETMPGTGTFIVTWERKVE